MRDKEGSCKMKDSSSIWNLISKTMEDLEEGGSFACDLLRAVRGGKVSKLMQLRT